MKVTLKMTEEISYAHRLQNHPGKCKTLHGHNALLYLELTGEVDEPTGMVIDFGDIKDVIRQLDHQTILEKTDPLVFLISKVHPVVQHGGPPTAENLAGFLASTLLANFDNLSSVKVLWPETCGAGVEVDRSK